MSDVEMGDRLRTSGGVELLVRSVTPQDEALLAEFFTHVTPDDLRFRFLSGMNAVPRAQLHLMTAVDHRRTESFLAFDAARGMLVATAMLACDTELETGEVAIVVRADYKHRGVGWEMLAYVAGAAQRKGLHTLEAIEDCENRAALDVERDAGFTVEPFPGDPRLNLVRRVLRRA